MKSVHPGEVEGFLMRSDAEAADSVKASLLLWTAGLAVILANLWVNPYWEGEWWQKLWLPAAYVGALVLLTVSKFNRKSEYGRIVFEEAFIRIVPRGGEDRNVFRVADVTNLSLHLGRAGFIRNPFRPDLGEISFESDGERYEFRFRLLKESDAHELQVIAESWRRSG